MRSQGCYELAGEQSERLEEPWLHLLLDLCLQRRPQWGEFPGLFLGQGMVGKLGTERVGTGLHSVVDIHLLRVYDASQTLNPSRWAMQDRSPYIPL